MFEKLKEILVEEMSINPADITLDAEFISDLGFNSLELADLVVICEEKFGVEFDDEVLPNLLTVRDVVNYLELNAE
ncbi:MAG: acyl carrier protein [Clostridiales bacterium]|jgi:acyl carrier protein|nr:acyl carrier protein [Clostridiales bacterium]